LSNAVPGLSAANVSIADTEGRYLSPSDADSGISSDKESSLERKIISTLEPVVGMGKIRASVVIERELSETETNEESYDNAGSVPLAVQRSEQHSAAQTLAGGASGVAANIPPVLRGARVAAAQALREPKTPRPPIFRRP